MPKKRVYNPKTTPKSKLKRKDRMRMINGVPDKKGYIK